MPPLPVDLLRWYDRHRRTLPWRALPGRTADPYHVWLSEIMLQQTTVAAVIPYFHRFLDRFPTVADLARARQDDVMAAWAGLGYYARARNLHTCAQAVDRAGGFPRDMAGLLALPGIGPYTAAAIAAIAFGHPVVPVDGNVERVTTRLFALTDPLPAARKAIALQAATLGDAAEARARPSDFAQALFDLGAGICTPKSPACVLCPWQAACAGARLGIAASLPAKAPKAAKPVRHGAHFHLVDAAGNVLLRRRPERGLLGGMLELPGTAWRAEAWTMADAFSHVPLAPTRGLSAWKSMGRVTHVFTHFTLHVDVYAARIDRFPNSIAARGGLVCGEHELDGLALPSLMRKCLQIARSGEAGET
ncbi:A/G-specific adenine glycosylase [Gluconacetobacter azotocaptans]|uniref:Adenine DNA glycosylase n=1 Tax=Gluconacetobacter azotocaptans TaxID=142834 RepID=A0A7W4JR14_9PROT|nr:A/G-specific adenine glycosylase [Gluconacetobacter azotocaptans]MBB2189155.1 A/G-specific adenine glycosylase [Gluconacetobacter azotocaptans]GBQ33047.1 DNA glycosylase A/G-specific MutY [Gluconacetobacter azotocaptans DSM 13594]